MTNMASTFKGMRLFCACHNEPVEMSIHEGSVYAAFNGTSGSVFYSCPKYYEDNRDTDEKPCFNRLSLTEYEKLIEDLSAVLEENAGDQINLTGYRYKNNKGTDFHVLKHDVHHIDVSVLNNRALMRKQS